MSLLICNIVWISFHVNNSTCSCAINTLSLIVPKHWLLLTHAILYMWGKLLRKLQCFVLTSCITSKFLLCRTLMSCIFSTCRWVGGWHFPLWMWQSGQVCYSGCSHWSLLGHPVHGADWDCPALWHLSGSTHTYQTTTQWLSEVIVDEYGNMSMHGTWYYKVCRSRHTFGQDSPAAARS